MKDIDKVIRKIDRPPSAFNFVRLLGEDTKSTTRAIVGFAKSFIPWSYRGAYAGIKARIEDGVDLATAKGCAGDPRKVGYTQNADLIDTFFKYDASRNYSALSTIGFDPGRFGIGKSLWVPVSPLTVVRESGHFNSVFVCGWNEVKSLNPMRRRVLMTIAEDAFLSLTDFSDQPAEFLFFPKTTVLSIATGGVEEIRQPLIWKRGDYELLKKTEIDEMIETFLAAREQARLELLAWAEEKSEANPVSEDGTEGQNEQDDLFR
jgi:hypothetical protein